MSQKEKIQAAETAISSPLRRSTRKTFMNSPALATATTKAPTHTSAQNEQPETKPLKTRRTSTSQENMEKEETVEKKPATRGRKASTSKEQPENKLEPIKTRSRTSSPALELGKEEESKLQPVTRRRRSSALEETSNLETIKPVRSRRSSASENADIEPKKSTRLTRISTKVEEPKVEPKRNTRSRRSSADKVEEIEVKDKPFTRSRRASSEGSKNEPKTNTLTLTPVKPKRKLSATENVANLEPIKEIESEIKQRNSSSPLIKDAVVKLSPAKVDGKGYLNLSVIDESSFVEETAIHEHSIDQNITPRRSPRVNKSNQSSSSKSAEKLIMEKNKSVEEDKMLRVDKEIHTSKKLKFTDEGCSKSNLDAKDKDESVKLNPMSCEENVKIEDKKLLEEIENSNMGKGSDVSFMFHLKKFFSTTHNETTQDKEDDLNNSKLSDTSDKENVDVNAVANSSFIPLTEEENQQMVNDLIEAGDLDKDPAPQETAVARVSNVFRPRMKEQSFLEPMDVDDIDEDFVIIEHESETLRKSSTTSVTDDSFKDIVIDEMAIGKNSKTGNTSDNGNDSVDDSFYLRLSVGPEQKKEIIQNISNQIKTKEDRDPTSVSRNSEDKLESVKPVQKESPISTAGHSASKIPVIIKEKLETLVTIISDTEEGPSEISRIMCKSPAATVTKSMDSSFTENQEIRRKSKSLVPIRKSAEGTNTAEQVEESTIQKDSRSPVPIAKESIPTKTLKIEESVLILSDTEDWVMIEPTNTSKGSKNAEATEQSASFQTTAISSDNMDVIEISDDSESAPLTKDNSVPKQTTTVQSNIVDEQAICQYSKTAELSAGDLAPISELANHSNQENIKAENPIASNSEKMSKDGHNLNQSNTSDTAISPSTQNLRISDIEREVRRRSKSPDPRDLENENQLEDNKNLRKDSEEIGELATADSDVFVENKTPSTSSEQLKDSVPLANEAVVIEEKASQSFGDSEDDVDDVPPLLECLKSCPSEDYDFEIPSDEEDAEKNKDTPESDQSMTGTSLPTHHNSYASTSIEMETVILVDCQTIKDAEASKDLPDKDLQKDDIPEDETENSIPQLDSKANKKSLTKYLSDNDEDDVFKNDGNNLEYEKNVKQKLDSISSTDMESFSQKLKAKELNSSGEMCEKKIVEECLSSRMGDVEKDDTGVVQTDEDEKQRKINEINRTSPFLEDVSQLIALSESPSNKLKIKKTSKNKLVEECLSSPSEDVEKDAMDVVQTKEDETQRRIDETNRKSPFLDDIVELTSLTESAKKLKKEKTSKKKLVGECLSSPSEEVEKDAMDVVKEKDEIQRKTDEINSSSQFLDDIVELTSLTESAKKLKKEKTSKNKLVEECLSSPSEEVEKDAMDVVQTREDETQRRIDETNRKSPFLDDIVELTSLTESAKKLKNEKTSKKSLVEECLSSPSEEVEKDAMVAVKKKGEVHRKTDEINRSSPFLDDLVELTSLTESAKKLKKEKTSEKKLVEECLSSPSEEVEKDAMDVVQTKEHEIQRRIDETNRKSPFLDDIVELTSLTESAKKLRKKKKSLKKFVKECLSSPTEEVKKDYIDVVQKEDEVQRKTDEINRSISFLDDIAEPMSLTESAKKLKKKKKSKKKLVEECLSSQSEEVEKDDMDVVEKEDDISLIRSSAESPSKKLKRKRKSKNKLVEEFLYPPGAVEKDYVDVVQTKQYEINRSSSVLDDVAEPISLTESAKKLKKKKKSKRKLVEECLSPTEEVEARHPILDDIDVIKKEEDEIQRRIDEINRMSPFLDDMVELTSLTESAKKLRRKKKSLKKLVKGCLSSPTEEVKKDYIDMDQTEDEVQRITDEINRSISFFDDVAEPISLTESAKKLKKKKKSKRKLVEECLSPTEEVEARHPILDDIDVIQKEEDEIQRRIDEIDRMSPFLDDMAELRSLTESAKKLRRKKKSLKKLVKECLSSPTEEVKKDYIDMDQIEDEVQRITDEINRSISFFDDVAEPISLTESAKKLKQKKKSKRKLVEECLSPTEEVEERHPILYDIDVIQKEEDEIQRRIDEIDRMSPFLDDMVELTSLTESAKKLRRKKKSLKKLVKECLSSPTEEVKKDYIDVVQKEDEVQRKTDEINRSISFLDDIAEPISLTESAKKLKKKKKSKKKLVEECLSSQSEEVEKDDMDVVEKEDDISLIRSSAESPSKKLKRKKKSKNKLDGECVSSPIDEVEKDEIYMVKKEDDEIQRKIDEINRSSSFLGDIAPTESAKKLKRNKKSKKILVEECLSSQSEEVKKDDMDVVQKEAEEIQRKIDEINRSSPFLNDMSLLVSLTERAKELKLKKKSKKKLVEQCLLSPKPVSQKQKFDESDEDMVSPNKLKKSKKIKKEKLQNADSNETNELDNNEEPNEFVWTMAEEGEEDTPSEDSNAIIDEGESINSTDTEFGDSDDEYDDNDSFICDEENEELLSGEEYDLSYEKREKKRNSDIIELDKIAKGKKRERTPSSGKKRSRIIILSDSSEPEEELNPSTVDNKGQVKSSEESGEAEQAVQQEIPEETAIEQTKLSPTALNVSSPGTEPKKKLTSITIQENINVKEMEDTHLTERISRLVGSVCNTMRKGEISEISMNVSIECTAKDENVSSGESAKGRSKRIKSSSSVSSSEEETVYSKKPPKRLSVSLCEPNKMSKKRKNGSSDEAETENEKDRALKKKKNISPKKRSLSQEDLMKQSFSLINQLVTDVRNRPRRTIKPSTVMDTSWFTEKVTTDIRPSTSLFNKWEKDDCKASKFHPKDFRSQILNDPTRVKRIDTKKLLQKKGVYL